MKQTQHLSLVRKTTDPTDRSRSRKNDFMVFIPKITLSLMMHLEINQELVQNQIERLDNNVNKLRKGTTNHEELESIVSRLKTLTSSSRKSTKAMLMSCDLR